MNIEPKPTLHKPVPMETRVRIPSHYSKDKETPMFGTVVGIALMHVIFTYIVLLDKPIDLYGEKISAVVVVGSQLESEDGKTNWRISE